MSEPVRINAESSALQEWQRVRRLSRWANNRRLRRVAVVLWVAVLGVDVWLALSAERHDPHTVIPIWLFLVTMWAMQRMGKGLALPTLEDRAVLQYDSDFDELKEKQRGEVFDQQVRDHVLGRTSRDEREGDLRVHAEAAAYRILYYIVAVPTSLCLIVDELQRFATFRKELVHFATFRQVPGIATVCLFCLTVIVFALPIMIRVWTEPDRLGEVRVVARGGDADNT